jgi:O-antigen/teichoic acid export membrane protein
MIEEVVHAPGAEAARATVAGRLGHATRDDRALLAGSLVTMGSRAFAKAAQILFVVIIARALPLGDFAAYSYLLALVVAFGMFADTGVALAAGREVARGRSGVRTAYWSVLPVALGGAALAAAALGLFGIADAGPGTEGGTLLLAAAFVALNAVFNLHATLLRCVGRTGLEALLQVGGALLFLALGAAAAAGGQGVAAILSILCLKETASILVAWWALREDVGAWTPPRMGQAKRLVRLGITLAVASSALALATRAPLIILAHTSTEADVAFFSAASRFAEAALMLATTAGFALLPGLTHLAEHDPARVAGLLRRLLAGALVVGAALGVAGGLLAHESVTVLFGGAFEPAVGSSRVLLLAFPLYLVVGVTWYALLALDCERQVLRIALIGALVTCAAGVPLVGALGPAGAAATYVLGLTAVALPALAVLLVRIRCLHAPGVSLS